jgi:hypothetical protein
MAALPQSGWLHSPIIVGEALAIAEWRKSMPVAQACFFYLFPSPSKFFFEQLLSLA